MIFSWGRKRASRAGRVSNIIKETMAVELTTPNHFRCPISLDIMKDPVTLSTGITYDRENIEKWIESGNITCPVTNQVLMTLEFIPNHTIRRMIQDWCIENRSNGVECIPTPRIPITSDEVHQILEKISMARSSVECKDLVQRILNLMSESERNKRCIIGNGAATTLAATFHSFIDDEAENVILLLEDVMSCLILMTPLDYEAERYLISTRSLDRLVWFINQEGISRKINAISILKELITIPIGEAKVIKTLIASNGAIDELIKLIKEPKLRNSSTKDCLIIIHHIITSISYDPSRKSIIVERFIEMGLVSIVLDILVDAEKGICEKALGVLDAICQSDIGRVSVYNNALTVPVVAKKILRISDLATEISVSILWKLCHNETREDGGVIVEALHVGAFQKLLLILQVGLDINEKSKERVTKLLKLLNLRRGKIECIESMDFKNLERSF